MDRDQPTPSMGIEWSRIPSSRVFAVPTACLESPEKQVHNPVGTSMMHTDGDHLSQPKGQPAHPLYRPARVPACPGTSLPVRRLGGVSAPSSYTNRLTDTWSASELKTANVEAPAASIPGIEMSTSS